MDLSSNALTTYLEQTCEAESTLLKKINRETHLKESMPQMLSGHYQGRLLSMISKMVQPRVIVEVGTFTGYATLCLAEGLSEDGIVHTIDINEELAERVEAYFHESVFAKQIKPHYGNALQIIPTIAGVFDLVFIDADKKNNWNYFEMVVDRVRPGGIILVDNVLWKGKVLADQADAATAAIQEFNDAIAEDKRIEKLILPVRDGLFLIRKR